MLHAVDPGIKDEPVVCGRALKFSSSDRGLWDTSVSHCSLCLVFTLLHRDYSAVCPAASATTTAREEEGGWNGANDEGRGDEGEVVGAPRRGEKLSLSLHCPSTALL